MSLYGAWWQRAISPRDDQEALDYLCGTTGRPPTTFPKSSGFSLPNRCAPAGGPDSEPIEQAFRRLCFIAFDEQYEFIYAIICIPQRMKC